MLSERIVRMEIFTFGEGGRQTACRNYLSGVSAGIGRLILLPIPSTKDKIHIKGTKTLLSEIYPLINSSTAIACYGLPSEIRDKAQCLGARVIDGEESEEFLSANAVLTAEGALGEILTSSKRSVGDMRIGVIGYGRIGSRLMRLLLFMGSRVRLYTRSQSLRAELGREGIESCDFNGESKYGGLDLLVNTAPVKVLSEEKMREYENIGLKILDLASGECFPDSPFVKKLASIPELMYPETAGILYGRFIERSLREDVL